LQSQAFSPASCFDQLVDKLSKVMADSGETFFLLFRAQTSPRSKEVKTINFA